MGDRRPRVKRFNDGQHINSGNERFVPRSAMTGSVRAVAAATAHERIVEYTFFPFVPSFHHHVLFHFNFVCVCVCVRVFVRACEQGCCDRKKINKQKTITKPKNCVFYIISRGRCQWAQHTYVGGILLRPFSR